jgi:glycosyltransferase involved in cell wall biosynthesis
VEWFSASFPGAPAEETIDGVRIVRAGRQWTVHWTAFRHYRGKLSGRFDIVVDEVNTIPFFTPLWADVPTVMLIHQLAREVWWYESPFPLNALGYLAEPLYLRLYRQMPVLTVSPSTRSDLLRFNFKGPISVIPEGLEPVSAQQAPKADEPTFIYVGRITPSKRVDHIIKAFALFRRNRGCGLLRIVGGGSRRYCESLVGLARRLGVEHQVVFHGHVSSPEKHRLMAEAHALLMTSVREGWGLVVIEANACGTPAIVYDVPGLRDSVGHDSTGLVVESRPENLFAAMNRLTNDPALYSRFSAECILRSRAFSFDNSASATAEAFERAVNTVKPVSEVRMLES